jgi:hypothetical protein
MKLRYSAVAAALVGFLLPSITMAQPDERYWGPGMMWGGGLFHMFFGFLMMILSPERPRAAQRCKSGRVEQPDAGEAVGQRASHRDCGVGERVDEVNQ